jgi:3-hydroxyisobutyrate dehydrogenase-like beta-hydroxyacid dehydrogenase
MRADAVGFAGLGIMGSRMAANLARGGVELVVWNRTRARAEQFAAEHGSRLAERPAELGERCETVITMVVDGRQVREVLLGDEGVAAGAPQGADPAPLRCVDCSTIGPQATLAIAAELAPRGAVLLDAPVTGSAPRAEDGTLTIMVGGPAEELGRIRPVLELMGTRIVHAGPTGHGQTVKLLNNAVAAANVVALGEALLAGAACGVDLGALVEVMAAGSASSTMLELKARPMIDHAFDPTFKLAHMLKDVDLCLAAAEEAGAPFPAAAHAREAFVAATGRGLGDRDFAAVLEALEGLAGRRL